MNVVTRRQWLLLALGLGLTGCGFRLAGRSEFSATLGVIRLDTEGFSRNERSTLVARLERAGSQVVDIARDDALRLRVRLFRVDDRRLVTGGRNGLNVVRLERGLTFSLRDANAEFLVGDTTLVQQKDFQIDDDNLLASTEDRENALSNLQIDLFDQLIRRLARI